MRSMQKAGVLIRADFEVYDSAKNPVTGLVTGDFVKLLAKNGVDDATAITVSEVGSGRYEATFTPATTGTWHLVIREASLNKRGWHETFDVTTSGVPTPTDVADALLDRVSAIDGYTPREALKILGAALAGKLSGDGSVGNPYIFRSMNDVADRINAVADSTGRRTTMTLTP